MTTASVIGPGTVIRGAIRGDVDVEIQGRVEGTIVVSGEVIVAESALIKSDIRARRVIVRGAVRGNVSADELLVLEPGARVLGDLGAPQVGIRPGGLVKGHVSTAGPLPLEKPKPAVAAKPAPAPARATTPAARSAPAARPAPAPVRPPPPPPRAIPAPRPSNTGSEPEPATIPRHAAAPAAEPEVEADAGSSPADPPPPVVPAMPKGARAQVRAKKGGK